MGNKVKVSNSKNGKSKGTDLIPLSAGDRKHLINQLTENLVMSREKLMRQYFDPRRDLNKECGYPKTEQIETHHYKTMYERNPVAGRVVEVLPMEMWQLSPSIVEDEDPETTTAFEKAFQELDKQLLNSGPSYFEDEEASAIRS